MLTVNKCLMFATSAVVTLLTASNAMAQSVPVTPEMTWIGFAGPFGAGLVTIGAAFGISKLAGSALEGMARQPEVAGAIQTAMIIAAALIEGFTFYALFICSTSIPIVK